MYCQRLHARFQLAGKSGQAELTSRRVTCKVRRQIAQQKWKWTELARFEGTYSTWFACFAVSAAMGVE